MEAILSSPSQGSPPDYSPNSSSDSLGSPALPDFSSPFTAANLLQQQQTPTKIINATSPLTLNTGVPDWLTDDLEEEWVEHDSGSTQVDEEEVEYDEQITEDYDDNTGQQTPRQQTIYFSPQSAIPSSIRTGSSGSFHTAGSPTILAPNHSKQQQHHHDFSLTEQDETEEYEITDQLDSVIGTFVIRDSPAGSMLIKDEINGGDQLRAAVRAFKGASTGLGGDSGAVDDATPVKKNLGGLMNLFQPLPTSKSLPILVECLF